MHYVIGDIHNELRKLNNIIDQISMGKDDQLYILGDLFDRGATEADPVGVYFRLSGLQGHVTWIRGNHDCWLADYIHQYYGMSERKQKNYVPYHYNSFELLKQRLTETDMLNLADLIMRLPLQEKIFINGKKYILAHAMTSHPLKQQKPDEYYLTGAKGMVEYFKKGIDGYISLLGHTLSSYIAGSCDGEYLDEELKSIWINMKENVYLMDCGCGFESGRLACMCLETGERYYSDCGREERLV
jgi:predicted phosphodiesterase